MMSIVQNAFANSASSLLVAKVQGNVVDFLMPPLSPLELNIGITFGGLTRGLFVGAGTFTAMSFLSISPCTALPWQCFTQPLPRFYWAKSG